MLDQQTLPTAGTPDDTETAQARPGLSVDPPTMAVEVVVEWHGNLDTLAWKMRAATAFGGFRLATIANHAPPGTDGPDGPERDRQPPLWRCRFAYGPDREACERDMPWLLSVIGEHMRWVRVEKRDTATAPPNGTGPTREMVAL